MKYHIKTEKCVFNDFFTIHKAQIIHKTFDGGQIEVERMAFGRRDAVGILVLEKDTESFLFVNQFRYPSIKEGDGWVLEIPAGGTELGVSEESQAISELKEETGYHVDDLEYIMCFFSSPGTMIERVFLYYCEVDSADQLSEGGGLASEQEDIEIVKIPVDQAHSMLKSNKIRDAKSIVALQWYFLNRTSQFNCSSMTKSESNF